MSWDQSPPEKNELEGVNLDWTAEPPSKDEVAGGPSPLDSSVRGFLSGASASFSDELSGGLEAAGRVVGLQGLGKDFGEQSFGEPNGFDLDKLNEAYVGQRDEYRNKLKLDSKTNPISSGVSNIAGALVSPMNKVFPGSMVKQGFVLGGATGLGNSEADDLAGLAKDTGMGAGLGAGLGYAAQKATPYLEKGVEYVGKNLKSGAENLAARAMGAERGTIKKLGADKVKQIGRFALDENLLTPLSGTDDLIAKTAAVKAQGASKMNQVYDAIDDVGAAQVSPLGIAEKIDDKIGDFYRSPINRGETNQLENTIESVMMRATDDASGIPLKEAQALKQELAKVANWKNNLNITDKERMAREAYGVVSSAIDDAAEVGAKQIGIDGLEDVLKQGKALYGKAKGAEELLMNKQAREQGNKLIGLTDAITGGAALGYGGVTDDWKTAGGIMVGKKLLGKYGAQTAALGLNKISKALLKSPKMLEIYQKNPAAFQTMVQKLEQRATESMPLPRAADKQDGASLEKNPTDKGALMQKVNGSKYAQVLQNAANNGDHSFSAAHYVLSQQDDDYRKLTE